MPGAAPESHSWREFSHDARGTLFTDTSFCVCLCWYLPSAASYLFPAHLIIRCLPTEDSAVCSLWTVRVFILTGRLKTWLKRDDDTQRREWLYPRVWEGHVFDQVRFQDMVGGEQIVMFYSICSRGTGLITKGAKDIWDQYRYFLVWCWHVTAPGL